MLYKLFCTLLMAFCAVFLPSAGHAAGITQYPALVRADYWMEKNKDGDQVLLDAKGVKAFNAKIRSASRSVPDLLNYPATVSGDSLKTRIMDYLVLDDDLYLHGNKVSENYKNILRKQTNVGAIPAAVTPRYAVTVRRSSLRSLPTGEGLYYYAAERDFDVLQETSLDPGEPLIVLHQSANKYFYYVQSVNYSGWISTFNIAFTDKKTWQQYADPDDFLVVTAANMSLKTSGEQVLYQQGARLPLAGEQGSAYSVEAPIRGKDGNLQKERLLVPKSADVHKGYLPYTSNNIVRSAFRFYGMPYGWGGLKNSVDCSSLVFNAYRTVGIYLPRNADEQEESAGTKVLLEALGDQQKTEAIDALSPGAALYMEEHTALYLGNINGVPYVIHSLGSYLSGGQRHTAMKVVVSDLTLQRGSGDSFLTDLRTAVEFR